jgi:hypothetical protein
VSGEPVTWKVGSETLARNGVHLVASTSLPRALLSQNERVSQSRHISHGNRSTTSEKKKRMALFCKTTLARSWDRREGRKQTESARVWGRQHVVWQTKEFTSSSACALAGRAE